MSQSAVQLPDPLDSKNEAASDASADDLLSQLAGDEIDRLLAEADVDPDAEAASADITVAARATESASTPTETPAISASAGNNEPSVTGQPAPSTGATSAGALPEAIQPATVQSSTMPTTVASSTPAEPAADPLAAVLGSATSGAPASPAPVTDEEEVEGELNQLLSELDKSPSKKSAKTEPVPPVEGAVVADIAVPERPLDSNDPGGATAWNERSALSNIDATLLRDGEAPVPIVLKPLVWINAPFSFISDSLRSALGKIAILTLVNAIAVLVYVMVFRK